MNAEPNSYEGRVCSSRIRYFRAAVGGCLLLAATVAVAVAIGRDYYHAKESSEDIESLRNVEEHHIGPGMDRMKGRMFPGALADFEFILVVFPNHPVALSLVSELCDVRLKDHRCDADGLFEKANLLLA